jgi:hypothetical protein
LHPRLDYTGIRACFTIFNFPFNGLVLSLLISPMGFDRHNYIGDTSFVSGPEKARFSSEQSRSLMIGWPKESPRRVKPPGRGRFPLMLRARELELRRAAPAAGAAGRTRSRRSLSPSVAIWHHPKRSRTLDHFFTTLANAEGPADFSNLTPLMDDSQGIVGLSFNVFFFAE